MRGEEKKDITALTPAEREALTAADEPPYRASQLERWLFARAACSFDEMSDLPAAFRARLAASFYIPRAAVRDEASDAEGTTKYVFAFEGDAPAEAVYLPGDNYHAACLSTQAGCAFGCRFCATGALKLTRNLTAYEIFAQFAVLARRHAGARLRNALFMGQGEPFANYDAVVAAIELLQTHFALGGRKITVSTVGLPDKIAAWADGGPAVKVAVSLHSAVQETRDELMPKMARHPLTALSDACRYYRRRTRRPLTFEYVLIGGVNDDRNHARALLAFAKGISAKVNVLPFNPWPGAPYRAPSEKKIEEFLAAVAAGTCAVTLRRPRGATICAACGTLANRSRAER